MNSYPIHTVETAPEGSKPALAGLKQALGLIPNLAATMANSPPLVNSFFSAFGQFAAGTFTGAERQILLLTEVTELLSDILGYPGMPRPPAGMDETPLLPIVPVRFARDGLEFSYFSTVTTLGTAQDVTLQELRIECFHPADDQTRVAAQEIVG